MEKEFILIADGNYNGFYYLAQRVNGTVLYSREVKRDYEWISQFGLTENDFDYKR